MGGQDYVTPVKDGLITLMREYKDIFVWCHEDMPGIDTRVILPRFYQLQLRMV